MLRVLGPRTPPPTATPRSGTGMAREWPRTDSGGIRGAGGGDRPRNGREMAPGRILARSGGSGFAPSTPPDPRNRPKPAHPPGSGRKPPRESPVRSSNEIRPTPTPRENRPPPEGGDPLHVGGGGLALTPRLCFIPSQIDERPGPVPGRGVPDPPRALSEDWRIRWNKVTPPPADRQHRLPDPVTLDLATVQFIALGSLIAEGVGRGHRPPRGSFPPTPRPPPRCTMRPVTPSSSSGRGPEYPPWAEVDPTTRAVKTLHEALKELTPHNRQFAHLARRTLHLYGLALKACGLDPALIGEVKS